MTMTQERERQIRCVGLHNMRKRPWTSHESGLCHDCLELRRDAMHQQARDAAAVSSYPFDQEDRQR